MDLIVDFCTDVGTVKTNNQDCVYFKLLTLSSGKKYALGAIFDGMGGLQKGEIASKACLQAVDKWFTGDFARLVVSSGFVEEKVAPLLCEVFKQVNIKISVFGERQGVRLGTTATVLLISEDRYLICHIGDCRVYEIDNAVKLLTKDQTVAQRDLDAGLLTQEQAASSQQNSVLLQCIGASPSIAPEVVSGGITGEKMFVLCCDGLHRNVSDNNILDYLAPSKLNDKNNIKQSCRKLIELAKQNGSRDNVSVLAIKVI